MTFGQVRLLLSSVSFLVFGSFYFPGFDLLPTFEWGDPPKSVLESKCERLWIDAARNDPALECYLISQTDRLCRPAEKEHLLWFISRYERDKAKYNAKLFGYLVGVQTGMAKSNGHDEDTLKKLGRVSKDQALKLKQDAAFVKAIKMRSMIDPDLTALLRKLVVKGYLREDDFGWRSPDWVVEAFDTDLKVQPTCKPSA